MNWIILQSEGDVDEAINLSKEKTVVFFKHSTRCPVSAMAKRKLERDWNYSGDEVYTFFLDLIRYRQVSNYIEKITGIPHESPQLIAVKNEKVIYHDSHHHIRTNFLST